MSHTWKKAFPVISPNTQDEELSGEGLIAPKNGLPTKREKTKKVRG
jgi:hypothetical protein